MSEDIPSKNNTYDKNDEAHKPEIITPSELGIDWDLADAVLDALVDRESESNKDKTNGELLAQEVKYLREQYKSDKPKYKSDWISEWADSNTEIYTTEVFKWYSQDASRMYYADDAIREFGYDKEGGIIKALQQGIYRCLEEFAFAVLKDEPDNREVSE
jgi:hypothetical protein